MHPEHLQAVASRQHAADRMRTGHAPFAHRLRRGSGKVASLLVRAWQAGEHVHQLRIDAERPWDQDGPLRWQRVGNGQRLIGSHLPGADQRG